MGGITWRVGRHWDTTIVDAWRVEAVWGRKIGEHIGSFEMTFFLSPFRTTVLEPNLVNFKKLIDVNKKRIRKISPFFY